MLLLVPSLAHGFADASQFFDVPAIPHSATLGASGEGIYFTGAPRFASLTCQSCHVGAPGIVGLQLNADDPSLFSDGYTPGKTYALQVQINNETEGLKYNTPTCTDVGGMPYAQCNNNGFALEVDAGGAALGGFAASASTLVSPDGNAVFSAREFDATDPNLIHNNDATSWLFHWTAPPQGSGPLTIYVAAVDGNGGGGSTANDQDPYGDDTVQANFFVQEAGAPIKNSAAAGCSVAATRAVGESAPLWLSIWFLLLRGIRRRAVARPLPKHCN
jgi:hypothetical protein